MCWHNAPGNLIGSVVPPNQSATWALDTVCTKARARKYLFACWYAYHGGLYYNKLPGKFSSKIKTVSIAIRRSQHFMSGLGLRCSPAFALWFVRFLMHTCVQILRHNAFADVRLKILRTVCHNRRRMLREGRCGSGVRASRIAVAASPSV